MPNKPSSPASHHPHSEPAEKTIWSGRGSQILNTWRFLFSAVLVLGILPLRMWFHAQPESLQIEFKSYYGIATLALFFLPVIYAYWHWLKVDSHTFRLTTQRLLETYGIFTRQRNNLELYRVKDIVLRESFLQYLVGCGTVKLLTSDHTTPVLYLRAVKEPEVVKDLIRITVEQQRIIKGVREFD